MMVLSNPFFSFILFFVPPKFKDDKTRNIDDLLGSITVVALCFITAPLFFATFIQLFMSNTPPPRSIEISTELCFLHVLVLPVLLKVTGRLKIISNYMCAFLYVTSTVNCVSSGEYLAFNCTLLPMLPIIVAFLENKDYHWKVPFWSGLTLVTCLVLHLFCGQSDAHPLRSWMLTGNLFNLIILGVMGVLFCTTRDIKQREMERQRDKANALSNIKMEFSANVSHEIRTPLVAIMGLGEILGTDLSLSQEQRYLVNTVQSASQHLLSLVNNILTFVKFEKIEEAQLEKLPVNLPELIDDTVRCFQCTADARRVTLMSFIDRTVDNDHTVLSDPHRIRQVLQNLVTNALKFCRDDGSGEVLVSLHIRKTPTKAYEFSITDNGIGISDCGQQKLFQPFQQCDNSTTRKYGGTGLGLVICKQICQLLGGDIYLQSRENMGTVVTFTLPFIQGDNLMLPACSKRPSFHLETRPLTVGIVTKSRLLHNIIGNYIAYPGFRMYTLIPPEELPYTDCEIILIDIKSHPELTQFSDFSKNTVGVVFLGTFMSQKSLSHTATDPNLIVRFCSIDPLQKRTFLTTLQAVITQSNPVLIRCPESPKKLIKEKKITDGGGSSGQNCHLRFTSHSFNVLVAEDNEVNREVIIRQLRQLGIKPDIFPNGQEAFQAFTQKSYDVVLMDCHMPVMDGLEATIAIRKWERRHHTRKSAFIVALTASSMPEEREKGLVAGMNHYMSKPVSLLQLRKIFEYYQQTYLHSL